MPSILEQVLWLLKKAGRCAKKNTKYYMDHPAEALEDLITYVKENPKECLFTCVLITGGVLVIVLPPAIGFGAAGPILGSIAAGWQSSIGLVTAGSAFAVIQSMSMTGAFTAIGAGLIGLGIQVPLTAGLLRSALNMLRSPGSALGMWYLHEDHTNPHTSSAIYRRSPGSRTEGITKRTLITNSRKTYDMVWKSMDPSSNSATIKEHARDGFDGRIHFIEGPRVEPGDEGFYERFSDHETACNEDCECDGDMSDVRRF